MERGSELRDQIEVRRHSLVLLDPGPRTGARRKRSRKSARALAGRGRGGHGAPGLGGRATAARGPPVDVGAVGLQARLVPRPEGDVRTARAPRTGMIGLLTAGVAAIAAAVVLLVSGGSGSADHPASGRKLTWAPPALHAPAKVEVTSANASLNLDPKRDYLIEMPRSPLTLRNGLAINGGHNIVLVGGHIVVPRSGRGLFLGNQTGTVHVEGLRLGGHGLTEGIDLAQPAGATVQLENVRVDEVFYPASLKTHPDVIQTWAGPKELRVDGLTATTHYQGFFLHPEQFGKVPVRMFDLRNVDITGLTRSAYLLWEATPFPHRATNVWVHNSIRRAARFELWPTARAWPGVRIAKPPGSAAATVTAAGAGYRSPGYLRPR